MSQFELQANWLENEFYKEISQAVAELLKNSIPVNGHITALEYGLGFSLASFYLRDFFSDIILMDGSEDLIKEIQDKIDRQRIANLWPLHLDLEQEDFSGEFDVILSTLISSHVSDIECLLVKFLSFLRPGGFLAITDFYLDILYDKGFKNIGLDVETLALKMEQIGYREVSYKQFYTVNYENELSQLEEHPMFLLTGKK